MDYSSNVDGLSTEIAIKGRFTFQDHARFRALVGQVLGQDTKTIVIDLAEAEFIDSAGLGMLLLVREEARKAERELVLRRPRGQVERMFSISCFNTLFKIEQ
jgi:HptB-dependent secretion and biofilm anti anti-sigma factor